MTQANTSKQFIEALKKSFSRAKPDTLADLKLRELILNAVVGGFAASQIFHLAILVQGHTIPDTVFVVVDWPTMILAATIIPASATYWTLNNWLDSCQYSQVVGTVLTSITLLFSAGFFLLTVSPYGGYLLFELDWAWITVLFIGVNLFSVVIGCFSCNSGVFRWS